MRDLPALGVALVNDGRVPAQTQYWESVSVPGIYFAGNVMGASAGLRKHGATSSAGSVNGGDSIAATVEYAADGVVTPVPYVRRNGRLSERALPTDPLHRFDTDAHRRQLDALILGEDSLPR